MKVPLNKPYWGKEEEHAVTRAVRTTMGTGDGPNSDLMARKLAKLLHAKYVFPVTSCTHAMDLAIATLGVGAGDEVIVPSFTMTSTANCIVLRGAKPVFVEIHPKTYNIDPQDVERAITKHTRGIMVVHYAGMGCEMEKIVRIAKKHKLFIVEDAAHSIGASYKGKMLGTWGTAGAFSFHGTKNVACGEGGALVTNDKKLADKIEIYRANGTNRHAFLKGIVPLYHWIGEGTSYFLSDILASVVNTQLDKLRSITNKRIQIASYYTKSFAKFGDVVQLPVVPTGARPNWHIYALKFKTAGARRTFQKKMREAGIEALTHYVSLHASPMGRALGGMRRRLPVTDDVAATLLRLPIYPGLTRKEQAYVVKTARTILATL
jgi:dTDP-4-amino-4,6-dideoxygalactose transaminase